MILNMRSVVALVGAIVGLQQAAALVGSDVYIGWEPLMKIKRRTLPPPPVEIVYDSAYVNGLIGSNAAAASGADAMNPKVVSLPAGRYILDAPIRIPNGTKHLVIDGAGAGVTILERTASIASNSPVVGVGFFNWFVSGTEINVENVTEGDTALTKKAGQSAPSVGGYYVLRTARTARHTNGSSSVAYERELIKIASVDGDTINPTFAGSPTGIHASLDHSGACRTYDHNDDASIHSTTACEDVTIKDLTINAGGAQIGLAVGTTDGLTLQNVEVKKFSLSGIQTWIVSDVLIDNCDVNSATAASAGAGYGIDLRYTHNGVVQNCDVTGGETGLMRHAVILHSGSTDILVKDCTAEQGSFDTHGFNERRIEFNNCDGAPLGETGLDIGNDAWIAGAEDVRVTDCDMGLTIGLHANVSGVVVTNGNFSRVLLDYTNDADAIPTTGKPEDAAFTGTTFNGALSGSSHSFRLDSYGGFCRFGTITFTSCTFAQPSTTGSHRFFESVNLSNVAIAIEGALVFDTCTFTRSGAATPLSLFRFAPGAVAFDASFNACVFNSSNLMQAIFLDESNGWGSGTMSVTNSTFNSGGFPSAAMIRNDFSGTPPTVVDTGNTVN
jgi:hypothetical protein